VLKKNKPEGCRLLGYGAVSRWQQYAAGNSVTDSEMLPTFSMLQMPYFAGRTIDIHPVLKEHFHTKLQRLRKQNYSLHMQTIF
jgi:hypothetical protein